MRDAAPPAGTADKEMSRIVEESEGHSLVSGLFSWLCKVHLPRQSCRSRSRPRQIGQISANYALSFNNMGQG